MTEQLEQASYIDVVSVDPYHAREIAAADLMEDVAAKLQHAFMQSAHSIDSLASALKVTVERVHEVISGDVDIYISTLARYLKELGEEVSLSRRGGSSIQVVDAQIDVFAEADGRRLRIILEQNFDGASKVELTHLGKLDESKSTVVLRGRHSDPRRALEVENEINANF